MTVLTTRQREARRDAIVAEAERNGGDTLAAIRTVAPRFTEAGAAAHLRGRVEAAVREALAGRGVTASSAPPASRPPQPAQPASAPPARPLRELSGEELARATVTFSESAATPFWRTTDAAPPPPPVAEAGASPAAMEALRQAGPDELLAVSDALLRLPAAAGRLGSPFWSR